MARDTGIADRIRRKVADYDLPLDVVEVDGWKTRGSADFNPRGAVAHHTASAKGRPAPSLGICTNGRPDLAGPLCNVLRGRFVNGRATVYVIAAGRANHAGTGGWKGLTGNSSVYGLEVENTGTGDEPWTLLDLHVDACILAALIEGCAKPDPELVCEHKEWAPGRKIDRHSIDGAVTRRLVAERLGKSAPAPAPTKPAPQEIDWAAVRRWVAGVAAHNLRQVKGVAGKGGPTKAVQEALNVVTGTKLAVDGIPGPKTTEAVKNFQRFFKLTVDGIPGPQTIGLLVYLLELIRDGKA